jgi:hypothetical protein
MKIGFMLITEAPIWFLLLCVASGATIALLLYFRNRDQAHSRLTNRWLMAIRFVAITLIAILLMNPLIKRLIREKEQPIIILAMDNSESMLLHQADTAAQAALLRSMFNDLSTALSDDYLVEPFTFGEAVQDSVFMRFNEKETDISALFSAIETRYTGRNTGAVVMISDGIWNRGMNPVTLTDRINFPVYTMNRGDTTLKRDLILAEVNYNRIAYLGNSFPVEVVIKAVRSNGLQSRLVVRNREKVFVNQIITINSDPFVQIVQLNLNAEKEGIQDYQISLEPLENEVTLVNNRTRAFIEVLSSRKRVLVLSGKPHPDLGAISNALASNDMIEVEVVMMNDFKGLPNPYDLVIMHQLPDDLRSAELFNKLIRDKIPAMIIGGGNTRLDLLAAAGAGPRFTPGKIRGQHNEVLGTLNPGFASFTPESSFTDQLPELPPLFVPFGKYDPSPGEQSIIFQRIGKVNTNYPLIACYALPGHRICHIAGEGIWKWRMFSFRNKQSHKPFDTFFNQIVQFLSAIEDKSRFRVSAASYFSENQNVILNAELYDASYNPVTDPEVAITISDTDQKNYAFTFTRKERLYSLDAGRLPVGEYQYTARTTLGAEKFSASGRFVVAPVHLESTVTRADHKLLRTLSHNTGGISVANDEVSTIVNHIRNRVDIKTVSHLREKYTDLTTLYWILAVILLLLSTEWFIRKRAGGY